MRPTPAIGLWKRTSDAGRIQVCSWPDSADFVPCNKSSANRGTPVVPPRSRNVVATAVRDPKGTLLSSIAVIVGRRWRAPRLERPTECTPDCRGPIGLEAAPVA